MDMHERLSKMALERVFRKFNMDKSELERVADHLARESIIVPHPGYGQIVYDVPDDYVFPVFQEWMDKNQKSYKKYYEDNLAEFYTHANLESVPDDKPEPEGFYWNNGYFPRGDARSLYAFVSNTAPGTFLEIGVGNSTRIARKAITDFGLKTRIKSIDPAPRADITRFSDEVIMDSVTNVDLDTFRALKSGDILFIDGSHVCQVGTDLPFFFLNVFPALSKGVIIHVHDIFLPWEYSERMRVRHYNEQHLLGGMLINSDHWDILFPVHYAQRTGIIKHGGGSMWFKKNK